MNSRLWDSYHQNDAPRTPTHTMPSTNHHTNGLYEQSPSPSPLGELTNGANPTVSPFANPSKPTSKVIERLTAHNDRLIRDLNAEKAKTQELTENIRAQKNVVEQLREENNSLRAAAEAAERTRKSRKEFEESLRNQLKAEEDRRRQAEAQATGMSLQLGQAHSDHQREIATLKKENNDELSKVKRDNVREVSHLQEDLTEAREQTRLLTEKNHYLDNQLKSNHGIYKQEVAKQNKVLKELRDYRSRDVKKLVTVEATSQAHDVIVGQMRQEMERKDHFLQELKHLYAASKLEWEESMKAYKDEVEQERQQLTGEAAKMRQKLSEHDAIADRVLPEAEETIAFLRYVKNLHLGDTAHHRN
ncbi:uncharacterized protein J3D65DRAFT_232101 [Phyllosticta citribraziliensis]|uniref:SWI5-dependent HO expression protein 3 n=1 Tax=Phyllosticta citribraziliensis TaxID=989973 RepID=A0ABR1M6W3_9PEZI